MKAKEHNPRVLIVTPEVRYIPGFAMIPSWGVMSPYMRKC